VFDEFSCVILSSPGITRLIMIENYTITCGLIVLRHTESQ
jgi:hypothetical protein